MGPKERYQRFKSSVRYYFNDLLCADIAEINKPVNDMEGYIVYYNRRCRSFLAQTFTDALQYVPISRESAYSALSVQSRAM